MAFAQFSFAYPLAFLALPLPWLAMRLLPPAGQASGALRVPETLVAGLPGGEAATATRDRRMLLLWLVWLLLVVALAGPQTVTALPATMASGRDIILSLDLSGSMERPDFEADGQPRRRIDILKALSRDFVLRRKGDRVGVVIFGERAFVASPLSFDLQAVAKVIDGVEVGLAGRSTAIGEGLGLALSRFGDSNAKARVIILVSDGAQNAGTVQPGSAAALAKTLGVKVDTIALGPLDLGVSKRGDDGVDTRTLDAIAEQSGGTGFRARTTEDLTAIMASIDSMETSAANAPPLVVYRSLWPWFGALALCACAFTMLPRGRVGTLLPRLRKGWFA